MSDWRGHDNIEVRCRQLLLTGDFGGALDKQGRRRYKTLYIRIAKGGQSCREDRRARGGPGTPLVVKIATGELEEDLPADREAKVAAGKARAESMTVEEQSALRKKAAAARWG